MPIDFSRLPDRDPKTTPEIDITKLPDKQVSEEAPSIRDVIGELGKTFGRSTLQQLFTLPTTIAEAEARDIEARPERALFGPGMGIGLSTLRYLTGTPASNLEQSISDVAKVNKERAMAANDRIEEYFANLSGLKPAERVIKQRIKGFETENLISASNIERALQLGAEGLPSLITAIAVSAATKNPLAGAAVLGVTESGELAEEAEEAGVDAMTSANIQLAATIGNTLLEVIPLNDIMKGTMVGKTFLKKSITSLTKSSADKSALDLLKKIGGRSAVGFIEEGTQEGVQQVFQNLVAKVGFDDARDLTQGVIDSVVGGALTGAVGGGGIGSIDTMIKKVKEKGLKDKDIQEVQAVVGTLITANEETIKKKLVEKPEIVDPKIRQTPQGELFTIEEVEAPEFRALSEEEIGALEGLKQRISQTKDKKELNALFQEATELQDAIRTNVIESKTARQERVGLLSDIVSQIPKSNQSTKPKEVETLPKQVKSKTKQLFLSGIRPSRIADAIDGNQNFTGPTHRIFIDSVNEAEDAKLRSIEESEEIGKQVLETNNLTPEILGQIKNIDGFDLTTSEIMHLYAARNNPENVAALIYGNKIPLVTMQKAINTLTAQEKQAADQITEELKRNFPRVKEAYERFKDGEETISQVEGNYIPMLRDDGEFRLYEDEVLGEQSLRNSLKNRFVARGFTKERTALTEAEQTPIRLGLVELYFDHSGKREQFVHFGNLVKDLRSIMTNKDFRESIKNNPNLGPETLVELKKYVDRVADPRILKAQNAVTKVMKTLRKNAAVAFLGFNPITIGKQLPSYVLALNEVSPLNLLSASSDLTTDFEKTSKFIHDRAPQMKRRSVTVELDEFKKLDPTKFGQVKSKIGTTSMKGILFADMLVTHSVWLAKYSETLSEGRSEREAVKEATNAVLRTQPAASAKDIPSLFADENIGIFIQFQNQLNNIFNIVTADIPGRFKLGTAKAQRQLLQGGIATVLNFFLIWAIQNGRLPTDEEDLKEVAQEPLNTIPGIGSLFTSIARGFSPGLPPALQTIAKADQFIKAKSKEKKLEHALEFFGLGGGIPTTAPIRLTKGILDLASGETEDLRRLIYSESVVKRGTPEEKRKQKRKERKKKQKLDRAIDDMLSFLKF